MRNRTIKPLLFLPLVLALACQDYTNPAPVIDSITPNEVLYRTPTDATIKGRHFYAEVQDSVDNDDPPVLDTNFDVVLGDLTLAATDVTYVDTETLDINTPADLPEGTHDLSVTTPGGRTATLEDALKVFRPLLYIEDAPGGEEGNEVGDVNLAIGRSLVLHAVVRKPDGSFYQDQEAGWSVSGDIGTLDTNLGTQAVFTATTIGTGRISAGHELYGSDQTGTITVVSCTGDADCHNPTPICGLDAQCRACSSDAECVALGQGFDRCDLLTGSCIPCLEHSDCGVPWPYCEPGTNTCVECLEGGHCEDGNVCTDDACVGFACSHDDNTASCDDGLFCNGADACAGGVCTHSGDPCPGTECNTCNETDDNCFDPTGTACTDDGLFCTGPEECNGAGACSGTGDPCPGTECNTCNEAADNCFDAPVTPCTDDGLFCTGPERCDGSGACSSTGNPCPVPADCDESNGICGACGDGVIGGTEDCDPGAAQNDHCCDVGSCRWTAAGIADPQGICSGAPECQVDVCDGGGGCTTANATDGTPCTDDGEFCTGPEECAVGTCTSRGDLCPGTECNNCNEAADNCFDSLGTPCSDDGDPCTTSESCDSGACMSGPADKDSDGDTHIDMACGGGDCDDADGNIHPGADDSDCDNVDDDCDATTDGGYVPTATACGTGVCASTGQLECQSGAEVDTCTPGAPTEDPEATCDDSLDNDCDGATDTGDTDCATCIDNDTDGYGNPGDASCPNGAAEDCNDADIDIHPGADDSDCDDVDDDCDSTTDGDYVPTATNCGTGVCAAAGQLECQSGVEVDTCTAGSPTEDPEATCDDNLDNDCDGSTDLGDADCATACNDQDGDGYGKPGDASCPNGPAEDCDDADPGVYHGTVCDDTNACTLRDTCRDGQCAGYYDSGCGVCLGSCAGGCWPNGCCIESCSGTCEPCAAGCSCDQHCSGGGNCVGACEEGSVCNFDANNLGGSAQMDCTDSTCFLSCSDINSSCSLECLGDSVCEIECTSIGANCVVNCSDTASCLVDCTGIGGTCQANCSAPQNCGGGVWVCNRPCP